MVADKESHTIDCTVQATAPGRMLAAVTLRTKGPYELDPRYPFKLRLAATPGVSLPTLLLRLADAQGVTPRTLTFPVQMALMQAGSYQVPAELSFSLIAAATGQTLMDKTVFNIQVAMR